MRFSKSLSLQFELFVSRLKRKPGPVYHNFRGAIKGTDPVAYFNDGRSTKGLKNISYSWNGASWHFASVVNRELFIANPEKYAPQFGGFCAYGIRNGYKIHAEPEAWSIVGGKLYLNYSKKVQERWLENAAAYIEVAATNWERLKKKY